LEGRTSSGVPEIKVGDGNVGALPIELRKPEPPTGLEPATTPLTVEVTVACAPGTPDAVPPEIRVGVRRVHPKK
jgi:hypothetical protein